MQEDAWERKAMLLLSELMWERYMRVRACERLRSVQRARVVAQEEAARGASFHDMARNLQDEVRHLQEQLAHERKVVNQLEVGKREWESKLLKQLGKNAEERQRMVELMQEADAARKEFAEVNAGLLRGLAERDQRVVRLEADVRKLAVAKEESQTMGQALVHFRAEMVARGTDLESAAHLSSHLRVSTAEVQRLRQQLDTTDGTMATLRGKLELVQDKLALANQEREEQTKQIALAKHQLSQSDGVAADKIRIVEAKYKDATRLLSQLLSKTGHAAHSQASS